MSVGLSVARYFLTINIAVFEDNKSSNDIIINDTISDGTVAADVPKQYSLPSKKAIYVV